MTRPTEYRTQRPDPAKQEYTLAASALAIIAIVVAVAAIEARTPGLWPVFVGWGGIVAVIVLMVQAASAYRARRAYASTVWRLSEGWLEMRSPTEWVRINRHQVERIAPAPDGIIVYGPNRVIAVPDAIADYDQLRAELLTWLTPSERPQQAAA